MAERTTTAKEAEDKKAPAAQAKATPSPVPVGGSQQAASADDDQAPDIAVDDLIARSDQFLGVPPYVAAGGLYGKSGDMSIDDAKAAIAEWLDADVHSPQQED